MTENEEEDWLAEADARERFESLKPVEIRGPKYGLCLEPGPYDAHCTLPSGHKWSCYDETEDVSFNNRQEFHHDCRAAFCPTPIFYNEGD